MEIWKTVAACPNYEVSSLGRVRLRRTGRIRMPILNRGYLYVRLGRKNYRIHRLVALAFLGDATANTVNHKDGDKLNNRVENLEYMSHADNLRHAHAIGLYPPVTNPTGFNGNACRKGENHSRVKLKEEDVIYIRTAKESDTDLSLKFKVHKRTILDIRERKTWKHLP